MRHIKFFGEYAFKHLGRERQRTAFVLFCIAAGVAAVVAMRSLGLMIDDALTTNLQSVNGGDLVIGGRVAEGSILAVLFFRDPLTAQPHDPDITALMRVCDVHAVPLATNRGTADAMMDWLRDR